MSERPTKEELYKIRCDLADCWGLSPTQESQLLAELDAVRAELDEARKVTPAMVQRAARGLSEYSDDEWRYSSEATRCWYLSHARRALVAALTPEAP